MRRLLTTLVSLAALQGCALLDGDGSDDGTTAVEFNTLERMANGSMAIGTGEQIAVVGSFDYSGSRFTQNGGFAAFFTDGTTSNSGQVLSAVSDNYEVASAFTREIVGGDDVIVVFKGMTGTSALPPTVGTATYEGDWGIAYMNRFGFVSESGGLTIDVSFDDSTLTGSGTNSSNTEVLTLTGATAADGSISGTWLFEDTITGDLEAAFFGDGANEIAGTITNDTHAGVIVATEVVE